MAAIMMFIDQSKCIGCKACQVACKQWHKLPVEETSFTGSYTNPPDLSGSTLTFLNFQELISSGDLMWATIKRQCMHCNKAVCMTKCPKGVTKTKEGFVVLNNNCIPHNVQMSMNDIKKMWPDHDNAWYKTKAAELTDDERRDFFLAYGCPYQVPRFDGVKFVKCDFCYDRFGYATKYITTRDSKFTTACEFACPVGAVVTDDKSKIMTMAKDRLRVVRKQYPRASLWGGRGRVLFLLTELPANYRVNAKGNTCKLGNYGLVEV